MNIFEVQFDREVAISRTETHFEIINGQSIFTMNENEDKRVWWTKSYEYYSVPDDNDNYHYRLKDSQEYEYGLSTPNQYSKMTITEYTYNDYSVEGFKNTYTVNTTTVDEDGVGTNEQIGSNGFTPVENEHLFKERIVD